MNRTGLETAGCQGNPVSLRVEAIQQIKIALARDAEDVLDALRHQRVRQDMSAEPCLSHGLISL